MNEMEKIQKYITDTHISPKIADAYCMRIGECLSLRDMTGPLEAIAIAFEYGLAKGYRAAKAEVAR